MAKTENSTIRWVKMGKTVSAEGTTITYEAVNHPLTIESRKRHIPHSGGKPGTWEYTSYFVLFLGKEMIEKHSLKDAKEYAEKLLYEKN